MDYIARFEDIESGISELNALLKRKIKLDHYNSNIKKSYNESYTPEMIEIVRRIYRKDIDIFEYCFK